MADNQLPSSTSTIDVEYSEHDFVLRRVAAEAHPKFDVVVSFAPTTFAHIQNLKTVPTFNSNSSHKTASFDLPASFPNHPIVIMKSHRNYMKVYYQAIEEEKQMMEPKPSSKFCSVCKMYFDDYLNHSKSKRHQKNIETNQHWYEIVELCMRYQHTIEEVNQQISMIAEDEKYQQKETAVQEAQLCFQGEHFHYFEDSPKKRMDFNRETKYSGNCQKSDKLIVKNYIIDDKKLKKKEKEKKSGKLEH